MPDEYIAPILFVYAFRNGHAGVSGDVIVAERFRRHEQACA